MADSYTGFSEMIKHITREEQKWIEDIPKAEDFEDDPQYEDEGHLWEDALFCALKAHGVAPHNIDLHSFPSFESEIHDHLDSTHPSWLLYTEEWCNFDHLEIVVRAFIKRFRPEFVFKMTYAEHCSKPRIGEFGGGWLVITKDEVVYGNTYEEADKAVEELRSGWRRNNNEQ